jgi:hypothetical protein
MLAISALYWGQVNPEMAAEHAAAAARKAMEAAQHAHAAAIYAGLLQKGAHEDDLWRKAGKCSFLTPIRCRLAAWM